MKHVVVEREEGGTSLQEDTAPASASPVQTRLRPADWLLVFAVFAVCFAGAVMVPSVFCPDEGARQLLSDWIYSTGTLPTGNEPETIVEGYEFSYALRPYLSAIIAALFMRIVSFATTDPHALLVASRMVSVLSVVACCVFCLKLGALLFRERSSAWLLAIFVCFLPQVVFLGMYQNNDALSLAAVCAIAYCLVKCHDACWSVRSCVALGVALSVGLLSYYTIYGWLLVGGLFCIVSILRDDRVEDRGRLVAKRAALVIGICLVLAGWFFVRNAMLHEGDFLGLASEARQRAAREAMGFELAEMPSMRDEGYSPWGFFLYADYYWIRLTAMSFVGVFGGMDIVMPKLLYDAYYYPVALGIVLYLVAVVRHRPCARDRLLVLAMLLAVCITFGLHFWTSYTRDFQPQGRYVISMALLLGYMVAYGLENLSETLARRGLHPAVAFSALWIALFVISATTTMSRMLQ